MARDFKERRPGCIVLAKEQKNYLKSGLFSDQVSLAGHVLENCDYSGHQVFPSALIVGRDGLSQVFDAVVQIKDTIVFVNIQRLG